MPSLEAHDLVFVNGFWLAAALIFHWQYLLKLGIAFVLTDYLGLAFFDQIRSTDGLLLRVHGDAIASANAQLLIETQSLADEARTPQERADVVVRLFTEYSSKDSACEYMPPVCFANGALAFETSQGRDAVASHLGLLYGHLYREEFSVEDENPLIANLLERQAPALLRMAMLLALTDMQERIDEGHVESALAWIRYASDSVRHVFTAINAKIDLVQAQLIAEKIKAYLDRHGSATRSQLIVDCFQRHQSVATIDAGLAHLMDSMSGQFRVDMLPKQHGGGRATTIYRLI